MGRISREINHFVHFIEIVKCNEFHITIEIATRMNHMYESNNRMKIVYFHSLRFNSDESGIFSTKAQQRQNKYILMMVRETYFIKCIWWTQNNQIIALEHLFFCSSRAEHTNEREKMLDIKTRNRLKLKEILIFFSV